LQRDDRQPMQGLEVVGLAQAYLLVELLGLAKPALLVQRRRLPKSFLTRLHGR
jgi:hypothetical protein